MDKDPAFLFYPGDYLRDTQCLSERVQVAYDRIMCEHMRNICITQAQLKFFTKKLTEDEIDELKMVLTKVDDGFQIDWVVASILKRRAYSDSRRKNRQKHIKDISKTYVPHMENEIENVNETVLEDRGAGKGWNTKPGKDECSLVLPDLKVGAVIELFQITKQSKVSHFQVQGLWNVFKVQNFTGKKFYQNEGDAYSHFINWCKTQNIENGSTHKQSSSGGSGRVTKSSGAEKLIDSLRKDLNA